MNFTLVLSDTHLSEYLPDAESGMDHRKALRSFDHHLSSLIDRANAKARSHGRLLTVVLNGDFFDLDAPPSAIEYASGLPDHDRHTATGAVYAMINTLACHHDIVMALARVLASGGTVVFVAGNHDAGLVMPDVRKLLVVELQSAASLYMSGDHWNRIFFRSVFYNANGIHIEHGHMYDPLCAPTMPWPRHDGTIDKTFGSVASYYAPAVLRNIYPYDVDPINLRSTELASAAWKMLSSDRGWSINGAAKFLAEIKMVDDQPAEDRSDVLDYLYSEHNDKRMGQHADFFARRANAIDALRHMVDGTYGQDVDARLRLAQSAIMGLYGCRGILFGHTHVPWLSEKDGLIQGNTGAWSEKDGSYAWIEPNGDVSIRSFAKDGAP